MDTIVVFVFGMIAGYLLDAFWWFREMNKIKKVLDTYGSEGLREYFRKAE